MIILTVCYYHVTYEIQRNLHFIVWMNVKELLARSRYHIWGLSDSNWIRTHNHLVGKQTLKYLAKPARIIAVMISLTYAIIRI